jgi:hypothetical protein
MDFEEGGNNVIERKKEKVDGGELKRCIRDRKDSE